MELLSISNQPLSIDDMLTIQKDMLLNVIGIEPKLDRQEFYYSISGIFQEAIESLEEDTRWKEKVFRKPGYKYKEVDRNALLLELTDILIYWMNASIHAAYNIKEDLLFTKILRISHFPDFERVFAYRKVPTAVYPNTLITIETNYMLKGDPMAFYKSINTIVIFASDCLRNDSPDIGAKLTSLFISIIDAYVAAGFNSGDLINGFIIKTNQKIEKFK